MIRSFGESSFPVAYAGQTSWHRPHSVHENESTISFHVRSPIGADAEAHLVVRHVEAQRLEPPAPPRAREEDVDCRRRDVQVLRVRQVGEEREDHEHVRPDEDALDTRGAGIASAIPVREERRCAGHSFSPAAMREACQPSSVRTTSAIIARMKSASPRCEPRSASAARPCGSTPPSRRRRAPRGRTLDERHEPALRAEPRDRPVTVHRADQRHHDRREEDEEAPEDQRVHHARHGAGKLLLAEHDHRLVPDAAGHVVEALERLRRADEPRQEERAAREQPSRDRERAASATAPATVAMSLGPS